MESLKFIGKVHSPLKEIQHCPLQENEGAPAVSISIDEKYREGLSGLKAGAKVLIFTWLDKADRNILMTKPRNDPNADTRGVFTTRSPDRPNPVGIHTAEILEINSGGTLKLSNLEVLDGTPVIDIKPFL